MSTQQNVYSIELPAAVTVYVKAGDVNEAAEKLKAHYAEMKGSLWLDLDEGFSGGDIEISGAQYDDDELPEISMSPTMTVHPPPNWELLHNDIECAWDPEADGE